MERNKKKQIIDTRFILENKDLTPKDWEKIAKEDPDMLKMMKAHQNQDLSEQSEFLYNGKERMLAFLIHELQRDNIKILSEKGPMYVWNEKTKLWEKRKINDLFTFIVYNTLAPLYIKLIKPLEQEFESKRKTTMSPAELVEITEIKQKISTLKKNLDSLLTKRKTSDICKFLIGFLLHSTGNFTELLNNKAELLPIRDAIISERKMEHVVLNLKTGECVERTKNDYFSYELDITYDPNAKCCNFDKFINQISCSDSNTMNDLQNILGYCITGEVKEKYAYFFRGYSGNNGKSCLLSIIENILKCKNGEIFIDELEDKKDKLITSVSSQILSVDYKRCNAPSPELYTVKDSRIAVFNEFNVNVNIECFKALTSGGYDKLMARDLYSSPICFVPKFKMLLVSNSDPNISEDQAILNRIKIIDFNAQFVVDPAMVNENKHIYECDLDITDKMLKNETERSGILNWLVAGAFNYYKNGLKFSEKLQETVKEFRTNNDSVNNFINDCCIFDETRSIK